MIKKIIQSYECLKKEREFLGIAAQHWVMIYKEVSVWILAFGLLFPLRRWSNMLPRDHDFLMPVKTYTLGTNNQWVGSDLNSETVSILAFS